MLFWGNDIRVMPMYVSKGLLSMPISQGLRSESADGEVQSYICIHRGLSDETGPRC